MFVSVIIPSYNKEKRLRLVLQTLINQDYGMNNFEVIVINDGSTDNTADTVMSFQKNNYINITHIYQENKGRAAARNAGIKKAKGDIILFLDDDRLVRKNFISEHVSSFKNRQDQNLVVLGKRMCLYFSRFDETFDEIQQLLLNNPEEIFKRAREEHYYWKKVKSVIEMPLISWMLFTTGNVSMGARLFEKVGLFNEGFQGWGYEDTELGYRLWNEGVPFISNEDAINFHLEHLRSRQEIKKDIQRNQSFMQKIHPEFPMDYFIKFTEGEISLNDFNLLMKAKR